MFLLIKMALLLSRYIQAIVSNKDREFTSAELRMVLAFYIHIILLYYRINIYFS